MPERAWSARIVSSVTQCHIICTRTVAQVFSLSPHPHGHIHVSVSLHLDSPFLFPALPHVPCLLPPVPEFVVNLHTPPNESMDSTDEFSLSTGYEPKAYDFYDTSVEPYMQLLDSPPLFSDKVSSADPDYDEATLEDMLHQAHRAQACHSLREDLSVSLSSSSMSDRTGRPVGDRPGRPGEDRNSEAQIGTLLDKHKEQILAEFQARINQHEFQAARAEEVQQRDQQLLQGHLLQQNLELRESHQRSLTEMEELRKFQSSTFDTIARRKLVEDQNTILELSGRIQELQNEINFMNDSKDFQDAEAIRSGNSHVTSRPVIPTSSNSRWNAKPFFRIAEPQKRAAKHLGHTWYIGKRFFRSRCVIISTLSAGIESIEFQYRRAASVIHNGKE